MAGIKLMFYKKKSVLGSKFFSIPGPAQNLDESTTKVNIFISLFNQSGPRERAFILISAKEHVILMS